MTEPGGSPQTPVPARPWRPLWWWFVVHGALVAAWALFALVSPLQGDEGWVLDGIAFGVMLVVAGAQLLVQGLLWRPYGPGWAGIFLGGVVAICFGAGCFAAGGLGDATAMFWVVIGFLVIEGAVFVAGTFGGFVFRFWGILMGGIVYLALVVMLVIRFTIDVDYAILDPTFGALGLLYGISMIVAAAQVRHAGIAQQPAR